MGTAALVIALPVVSFQHSGDVRLAGFISTAMSLGIAGRRPDPQWLDQVVTALGLTDRLTHRPGELSGGQQQRVACARAWAGCPEIVFADEPTGNLGTRAGAEVLSLLGHLVHAMRQTIVMVTHDPAAAVCADRVVLLADGHVGEDLRQPDTGARTERMERMERMERFDGSTVGGARSRTAVASARVLFSRSQSLACESSA